MLLLIDTPGFGEILMIGFIALLLFGGKLPDAARKLGRDLSGLKKNLNTLRSDFEKGMQDAEKSEPENPPRFDLPENPPKDSKPPGPS